MLDRIEQERTRLVAWIEGHQLPTGTRIDREATADALMTDFITPLLAELAALRSKDREDGEREAIRWEARDGGWWAHSANLHVGFVVKRPAEGGGFEWAYEITAVFTKWITKGHGQTGSLKASKAAVERAWAAWLEHAGLVPALPLTTRTEDGDA